MKMNRLLKMFLMLALAISGWSGFQARPAAAAAFPVIYTFDLRQVSGTFNTAESYDIKLFVSTLQGIVNQKGPRLYVYNSFYVQTPSITSSQAMQIDEKWLDAFRKPGQWLSEYTVTPLASIEALVSTFRSDLAGLAVWDPKVDATANVATTIAGIERTPAVMGGGRLYARLTAAPNSLTVSRNLVGQFAGNNAKTDAYVWAKQQFLDTGLANAGVLGYIEDAYARQPITHSQEYTSVRDVLVMRKAFVFDLSPWGDERAFDAPNQTLGKDLDTFLAILQSAYTIYGSNNMIEVYGFFPWWDKYSTYGGKGSHTEFEGEWKTVEHLSKYNAAIVSVIDTMGDANMSVHWWAPVATNLLPSSEAGSRPTLANKTYILWGMGDHDESTVHYQFPYVWNSDPARGKTPIAWNIVPGSRNAGDLMQFLYDTATSNDYFVAGAGAAGYANPDYVHDASVWRNWNERLYRSTGYTMSGFVLNGNAGPVTSASEEAYRWFSNDMSLFYNPNLSSPKPDVRSTNMVVMGDNVPIANNDVNGQAAYIYNVTATLASPGTTPNFLYIKPAFSSVEYISQVMKKIVAEHPEYNFEAVDPYTYASLIRQKVKGSVANDAIILDAQLPDQMIAGQKYTASVTVRNVGTAAWTEANLFRLAATTDNTLTWSDFPDGGYSLATGNQRVFLAAADSIQPQQTKTFTFQVQAPATPGNYVFGTSMIKDGTAVFGDNRKKTVQVVAAPAHAARITAVTVPSAMTEEQLSTVSVTVKNIGTATWTAADNFRLAAIPDRNEVLWSAFASGGSSSGAGIQRAYLSSTDSIAPGASKTFNFSIAAPRTRGTYTFAVEMIKEGVSLFGDTGVYDIRVTPGGAAAKDAVSFNDDIPEYVVPGAAVPVSVTFKNTGTNDWTRAGNYTLKSAGTNQLTWSGFPYGGTSAGATDQKVYMRASERIKNEQAKTFSFSINAPTTPGAYTLSMQMNDGTSGFGAVKTFTVNVAASRDAKFTAWDVPTVMAAGTKANISIDVQNAGANSWMQSDLYRLYSGPTNQFVWGDFGVGGYSLSAANQRIFLSSAETIAASQRKGFSFSIQAPSTPGTYTLSAGMVQDGVATFGTVKTWTINVVSGYEQRVDVGATAAYTDANGKVWAADQPYSGTNTWGYTTSTTSVDSTSDTIAGTDDPTLYRTQRFGGGGNPFAYKFNVSNGTYKVTLDFAEIFYNAGGSRSFNVDIEGVNMLTGYDLFAAALGHDKARRYEFSKIAVTDGVLDIDFSALTDAAAVNAIQVVRTG
ncbi:malectin domain-containing carbohydrate-binding protein [Cohnella sp. GCM10012308]|uniref:malectin domain-containing carbohydrate-binding protein n=1 Tax=Cohnella sp. GCM10012308 TaxID=3317329 RepID=UPI00361DFB7C